MKKIILISSILLLACKASETETETEAEAEAEAEVNKTSSDVNSNALTDESKKELNSIHPNNNTEILEPLDAQGYSVQKSLEKTLNSSDTREVAYLVHPLKRC